MIQRLSQRLLSGGGRAKEGAFAEGRVLIQKNHTDYRYYQ
jgi:hypothetical protein